MARFFSHQRLPVRLSPTVADTLEFPDTEEVSCSNPVRPTRFFENLSSAEPKWEPAICVLALRRWSEHLTLRSNRWLLLVRTGTRKSRVDTCWSDRRPDTTAACPLTPAASLDQRLMGGFVIVTGSAVQPATGQRLPDEVFSLMLAEVAGGKRRD